jgi:hypothetical protein
MCECRKTRDKSFTVGRKTIVVHAPRTKDEAPKYDHPHDPTPNNRDVCFKCGETHDDWSPEARAAAAEARRKGVSGGAGSELGRALVRIKEVDPEEAATTRKEHQLANHVGSEAVRLLRESGAKNPSSEEISSAIQNAKNLVHKSGKHDEETWLGAGIGTEIGAEEAVKHHFSGRPWINGR